MKIQWKGVYPAVTTKFTSNDELDLQAFDVNINAQIEAGVNGIILGGSLGEASTLSEEEKFKLLMHSVELADGKIDVVLNIAEQSTKVAIDIAKRAEDSGADALMLLPPMRYKSDDRETVTFFKDIAKSTSLPIMLYNNPVDYKIMITLDMFDELAEIDNIQAVKESTRDVMNITRMYNKFGSRYKVLCGVDPLALESLVLGCDGWVAGLVDAFPKETVAIYRLIKAGRYAEALAIYRWFMPLLELDIHPKLVQYIKLAEVYTGIGTETVRSPRLTIEGAEREAITKVITDALAIRPELPADSWGPVSINA
jgi:1-pyrroline-4-hydroxy-2-carboxylate deaminase